MKTFIASVAAIAMFASVSTASEPAPCDPEIKAEIDAMLEMDPNAPGKEVVGEQLAELIERCPDE